MRLLIAALVSFCLAAPVLADIAPREGWVIQKTDKSYKQLIADVKTAVKANKFGVVTQAGPTGAAKNRGITIPGNRVIGVFNNIYAVRILNLSTAAMIEAPIRLYITENADETATLSYKTPSTVFAPYLAESDPDLGVAATELDAIFKTITDMAAQ